MRMPMQMPMPLPWAARRSEHCHSGTKRTIHSRPPPSPHNHNHAQCMQLQPPPRKARLSRAPVCLGGGRG